MNNLNINTEMMSDDIQEYHKTKVARADIVITKRTRPYFEIRYFELDRQVYCLGFSSHNLFNVLKWRKEYLEIVDDDLGLTDVFLEEKTENLIVERLSSFSGHCLGYFCYGKINEKKFAKALKDKYGVKIKEKEVKYLGQEQISQGEMTINSLVLTTKEDNGKVITIVGVNQGVQILSSFKKKNQEK